MKYTLRAAYDAAVFGDRHHSAVARNSGASLPELDAEGAAFVALEVRFHAELAAAHRAHAERCLALLEPK